MEYSYLDVWLCVAAGRNHESRTKLGKVLGESRLF
jgi:hypothetical protein